MKTAFAICALLLTACGADGPPLPPSKAAATPDGLHISGEARVGVVKQW
ncbi:MAG: hypothetical protein Q7J57_16670 [Gemmobacter sp.]|nr:hypothetical protein [Gemmobacter sp.]